MNVKGKVVSILPVASGTSKAGNEYKKGGFVIETTEDNYPKKIAFSLFGEDKIKTCPEVGELVNVSFDITSREFNGKWYHDISAWQIAHTGNPTKTSEPTPQQVAQAQPQPQQPTQQAQSATEFPF